jgi:hypothetical protein
MRESAAMARWTSFVARLSGDRTLHEDGNPDHRLRVEHDANTLLIHLSGEDGSGWTTIAVDRTTRETAVAHGRRQLDAATEAHARLYGATGTL